MTEHWRLLNTGARSGAWNMAFDEAVLEHAQRGEVPTTLRFFSWDPACLSLGQGQSSQDVDVKRLEECGWELVRRLTGGRAILHTDELTYSVIGSTAVPALAGTVLESYRRLAQALRAGLSQLGLDVEMKEHARILEQEANPVCFEVPSAYEITVGGRKLIGSAQARRKDGVIQHGSLPLEGDLTRICEVLSFESESQRMEARERLSASALTVKAALGRSLEWSAAAHALASGFESELAIVLEASDPTPSELDRADALVAEKYAHPSWTTRL